ncbi:hypothetical protein HID58_087311 [Brassica napus]|uniref:(rape) hypothetical protein n=1 Tax=Brassica napus TaxID=3708 RepID=A0A816J4P6_BRANA|nr:hypothetical protein HID58_087311 [Brassica napus]CAF1751377.1 unnamed protein product [Brassica napus]
MLRMRCHYPHSEPSFSVHHVRSEPNHPFDTLEHKLLYAVVDLENIMNEGKNSKNSAPSQHPARKVEAPGVMSTY